MSLSFPSVCVFRLMNVIPERIIFVSRGITVQYNCGDMFAPTESEDIHKLPSLFAHTFEVFRLYCCTAKTKATHITLLPTELI
jgi:hypothetical protein